MESTIQIRQGEIKDLDTLVQFNLSMAKETEALDLPKDILKQGIMHGLKHPEVARYFVAEEGNKIVGSLMITMEWSDWRNAHVAWIQSVYVLPEYRRKKIFKSMYQHIKHWVEQRVDLGGIRLYVDKGNLPAIQTYKNIGMNGEHYQLFEWMKSY
jgi:GNAT superfamily N-acetyltransferase